MRTRSTTIRIDSITPTLTATIGHPEMNAFRNAIATATTVAELDAVVHAASERPTPSPAPTAWN